MKAAIADRDYLLNWTKNEKRDNLHKAKTKQKLDVGKTSRVHSPTLKGATFTPNGCRVQDLLHLRAPLWSKYQRAGGGGWQGRGGGGWQRGGGGWGQSRGREREVIIIREKERERARGGGGWSRGGGGWQGGGGGGYGYG
ncbi:hypothetical protein L596_024728 [Steinernema carpocapsae]|uniref:Uncharacterized protein n=1 Tax=Steinernema carpocapsae TaxID=34508 RepID=A0A4U5M5L5_STECR|nr:hypothetical protein L596_024728 [Steinernema carpocapsae]